MTIHEETIAKIRELPEPLVRELNDWIDFLFLKRDGEVWQRWLEFREATELAEFGMSDYLANLSDYEDRLARGEIQW